MAFRDSSLPSVSQNLTRAAGVLENMQSNGPVETMQAQGPVIPEARRPAMFGAGGTM